MNDAKYIIILFLLKKICRQFWTKNKMELKWTIFECAQFPGSEVSQIPYFAYNLIEWQGLEDLTNAILISVIL